jgi:hypothetical protein
LKITTVFPVGTPLVTLIDDLGATDAADEEDGVEAAVGASEQAFKTRAAGTASTDHRARLARIDMIFFSGCRSSTLNRGWTVRYVVNSAG